MVVVVLLLILSMRRRVVEVALVPRWRVLRWGVIRPLRRWRRWWMSMAPRGRRVHIWWWWPRIPWNCSEINYGITTWRIISQDLSHDVEVARKNDSGATTKTRLAIAELILPSRPGEKIHGLKDWAWTVRNKNSWRLIQYLMDFVLVTTLNSRGIRSIRPV